MSNLKSFVFKLKVYLEDTSIKVIFKDFSQPLDPSMRSALSGTIRTNYLTLKSLMS